jgi:hypothetical protein
MMDETDIVYISLSLIIILIVFGTASSFGKGWSIIAVLLAFLALILILALNWIDFVIVPMFTKMFGMSFQAAKDYTIQKGQDSIIKNVNGLYYATGFVTGNLFSYTFKEEDIEADVEGKMMTAPENWERAVMSLGFPFKFHVIAVGKDVQKIRDEIEGKRSYQEFQLSQALQSEKASSETAITEIKRKISIYQARLDRISAGEKPIAAIMYFETTAVGVSEKAAEDALALQIKQLQIAMSSLNLHIVRVVGRELYTLFKFNFGLPLTYSDLASEFSQEG